MTDFTPYTLAPDAGGEGLPLHWLFRELRERWLAKATKKDPRRSRDLADRFGTSPQAISQWASGTDPSKVAPWWVILSLASELRLEVRISGSDVSLGKLRRKRS
jgi:transcriptional regulator with XRE-family HTH domain